MYRLSSITIVCVLMGIIFMGVGWCVAPQTMSFQGFLTNKDGKPVADGSYIISFALYTTETGGNNAWTEQNNIVTTKNGIYNIVLGEKTLLSTVVFDNQYWLGVKVGNEAESSPRFKLTASPYSFMAKTVEDNAITLLKISPSGASANQVVSYNGSSIVWANQGFSLPYEGSTLNTETKSALSITQNGSNSPCASFLINNNVTTQPALFAGTEGTSAGGGRFYIGNEKNNNVALYVQHGGTGWGIAVNGGYNYKGIKIDNREGTTGLQINGGYVGIGNSISNPTNILTIERGSKTAPVADSWLQWSSIRWKTNVKQIDNALNIVQRLTGVTFNWKENGKQDIGFIAEDVGKVIPEIVEYETNSVDAKGMDYARITSVLVEAVKEQQQIINKQQETINNLAERISRLENGK